MKRILVLLAVIISLMFSLPAYAEDKRCPLTGNTYSLDLGDIQCELSGFDCTFGPGCEAECDLWWGDFDTGPLYHARLPFSCWENGDVVIAGLPCALTSDGDLECIIIDTSCYHCQEIGTKMYCLPKEAVVLQFGRD